MVPPRDSLNDLKPIIEFTRELSKTERCSVAVGFFDKEVRKDDIVYNSFPRPVDGPDIEERDTKVYFIASLAKRFIAFALWKIIEVLSEDEDSNYNLLRNGWHQDFAQIFNTARRRRNLSTMKHLYRSPTIQHLVVHCNGVYPMNHVFLAPDGTPILSAEDFIRYAPQWTEATGNKGYKTPYSNANYVWIGLLIETVSGKTLGQFLIDEVFIPLGMHATLTSTAEFEQYQEDFKVIPHHVFDEDHRHTIKFTSAPTDTIGLASLGLYSCTADLATFDWALLSALKGTAVTNWLTEDFVRGFLGGGINPIDENENGGYTPYGLYEALDTSWPGSHSLNRLLLSRLGSDDESSDWLMGKDPLNKEIYAYYQAGTATGWACASYFVPNRRLFVTVLTNTSGPLDASDLISRLVLQELLDLRPLKLKTEIKRCSREDAVVWRMDRFKISAREMYKQNLKAFQDFETEDTLPENDDRYAAENHAICGKYMNRATGQFLLVTTDSTDNNNKLRVRMCSQAERSSLLRFVRQGENFRICSLREPDENGRLIPLAVDCFGAWRTLEFVPKRDDRNNVVSFSWKGVYLTETFYRDQT